MQDQLVTYPVAKLAKEKGFAEKNWDGDREWAYVDGELICSCHPGSAACPAVSQSLLHRWLRETHQLHVQVSPKQGHLLEWYVYVIDGKEVVAEVKALFFTEYEAALERGLELALNLLEDVR